VIAADGIYKYIDGMLSIQWLVSIKVIFKLRFYF
jgi:hypothetical protein